MTEIQAPSPFPFEDQFYLFLAGSIEMGVAEQWQRKVVRLLANTDITILNPRRDDWDASWDQSLASPNFVEQVRWEQEGLRMADIILFYFDKNTMSPITLMELGMAIARDPDRIVVVCPEGYWRKGNVDVVCMDNDVYVASTLVDAVIQIKRMM